MAWGGFGNEPTVINRRQVAVCKAKEKGMGKEKCPLDPLKRKGQGKRTRPGFLRNLFQDRALPCACSFSEAGAAAAEIVGNCFPQCAKDYAFWAWYCRHFDRNRIVERAYYYASCQRRV